MASICDVCGQPSAGLYRLLDRAGWPEKRIQIDLCATHAVDVEELVTDWIKEHATKTIPSS